MNAPCGCGSGKKFKKCCFLKNAPADQPHLRMGQIVVDNIWKRFPQSNTTREYWLTEKELAAFNALLDNWLRFPPAFLEPHGLKIAAYNAISDLKHDKAVRQLFDATFERMEILPTTPNHFRTLGEMARIFHKFRLKVCLLRTSTVAGASTEKEQDDVTNCIREFHNMLMVGVHNKSVDAKFMEDWRELNGGEENTALRNSGNGSVSILIDISNKRVHEVPNMDANSDVLCWTRKKNRHYSSAYLGCLADYIDTEGRPLLATEWLVQQKIEHIQSGNSLADDFVPALPTNQGAGKGSQIERNWVYMHGSRGSLRYLPEPTFLWKMRHQKDNIIGYLRYLNLQFIDDSESILSPSQWLESLDAN